MLCNRTTVQWKDRNFGSAHLLIQNNQKNIMVQTSQISIFEIGKLQKVGILSYRCTILQRSNRTKANVLGLKEHKEQFEEAHELARISQTN